jgi:dimethylargininase
MALAPRYAIVRPPSPRFTEALGQAPGVTIDLALALAQHAAYVGALGELGLEIVALAPLADFADACFVEDTAIVFGDAALVTRPGAPSRRGEEETVARALGDLGLRLTFMQLPATLDGGDVLRVGSTFFVGASARSNRQGMDALARFARRIDPAARVVPVPLPEGLLHLKCDVSALSDDTVLAACDLPLDLPAGVRRLDVPRSEAFAANAVAVGRGVLVAAGHPEAAAVLLRAGFVPRPLVTSELAKADGSLTCLSILC